MTFDHAVTAVAAAVIAAAVTRVLLRIRLTAPPPALMRRNVSGRMVPAVMGGPLALGAYSGMVFVLAARATGWDAAAIGEVGVAVALLIAVMTIAGAVDDRTGDEARGFAGHLRAAARGRVTGGLLKIVAGTAAGIAAGVIVARGWAVVETAALVALGANLVNLLDRAPGRAGKAASLAVAPLVVWAPPEWTVAAAGLVGALAACLPADLRERAMLGDAGANPLGAVVGLGLAMSLSRPGRIAAIVVLLALNAASERWSFSAVIERAAPLRAFDRLGRRPPR